MNVKLAGNARFEWLPLKRSRPLAEPAAPPRLRLLGEAECRLGDGRIVALERKDALLLGYVAIEGPTSRARLSMLLWPDVDVARGRANLRQRLHRLRQSLGFEALEGAAIAALGAGLQTDLDDEPASPAVLLAGIGDEEAGSLAGWLDSAREQRKARRIDQLAQEASRCEQAGELALALDVVQRLLAAAPNSEHAHRRLMRLHYLRGDRAAALAAFDHCCDVLERSLGVAPEPETEALRARVEALSLPIAREAPRPLPVSVLRPPRLIGREREWDAIEADWAAGCATIVVGEAGAGKTRLLRDFCLRHPAALIVDARPGETRVPHALLSRLLRALHARLQTAPSAGVVDELARLLPELGRAGPMPQRADGARFLNAVTALARQACGEGLAGLVVDDLQFADDASVDVLRHLVGAGIELRWIVAMRPGEIEVEARALHDELLASPGSRSHVLRPLDRAQVAQLIDSLGIVGLDGARHAEPLVGHTGGNPLFLLETVKLMLAPRTNAASAEGSGDVLRVDGANPAAPVMFGRLPSAGNVTRLIEQRLGSLSSGAIRLARCAAIAGADFSSELAEHVLGVRALDFADAWTELDSAQVLRDATFAHDLIYETALATVPAAIAAHLHEQVARYLETIGAEPAHIALHWEHAGFDDLAGPCWMRAAQAARDRGCAVPAAGLCDRAVAAFERSRHADAAFDALCSAASYLSYHGSTAQFGEVVDRLVVRAGTPAQRARAWLWRVHLEDLRGAPIESVESDLRAGLLEAIASAQPAVEAEYRYELGVVARRKGELSAAAEQFAATATLMEGLGMGREAAEARTALGASLSALGRLHESARWMEAAEPLLRLHGAQNTLGYSYMRRAIDAESAGRAAEGAVWVAESMALLQEVDAGPHDWCVIAASMLESLSAAGRYREALGLASEAATRLRGQMMSARVTVDVAIAHLYLALGRPELARQSARFEGLRLDPVAASRVNLLELAFEQFNGGQRRLIDFGGAARVDLRFELNYVLEAAKVLEPSAAVDQLSRKIAQAEDAGLMGFLPALRAALAKSLADHGHPDAAAEAADRALAASAKYTMATTPTGFFLDLTRANRALDRPVLARQAAEEGCLWLRQRLQADVPTEFRSSMQQRNPVHRALLLAARASA